MAFPGRGKTKGDAIAQWMDEVTPLIREPRLKERVSAIHDPRGLASYLYLSDRCALSHANLHQNGQVIDPDNPADHLRITLDLPVVKVFAKHVIESGLLSRR